ncbi:MAG TPA: aminoglycoside adenylyltransferase domain-containing protein [Anaerolineae bacterium]|jgi:predicted nucleotidyltransferase
MHPTPDLDINALLRELLAGVQAALGDALVGLYLHGSLAYGDFEPQRSDIDFLVVTKEALASDAIARLKAMHARLTASGMKWASKLEGSYIPAQALRYYDPADCHHPALRADGSFDIDGHGSEWVIQRYIIRAKGIAIAGPPPQMLIDPVTPEQLRGAAAGILFEWWEPQLTDHSRVRNSEYQAYAVLTMCRALYTLQFATVASKPVAAKWAQRVEGWRWSTLIDKALAWRHGDEMDYLGETLDLMRYTIETAQCMAK